MKLLERRIRGQVKWDILIPMLSIVAGILIAFLLEKKLELEHAPVYLKIVYHVWLVSIAFFVLEGIAFVIKRVSYERRQQENESELRKMFDKGKSQIKILKGCYEHIGKKFFDPKYKTYTETIDWTLSNIDKHSTANEIATDLMRHMQGAVLTVDCTTKQYFTCLGKALGDSKESLLLTCFVPPQWFFDPNDDALRDHEKSYPPLSKKNKKELLDLIEKTTARIRKSQKPNQQEPTRVVVYDRVDIDRVFNKKKRRPWQAWSYFRGARKLIKEQQSIRHYFTDEHLIDDFMRLNYPDDRIRVEDCIIFDRNYLLQYSFSGKVLRARWANLSENVGFFTLIDEMTQANCMFDTVLKWVKHKRKSRKGKT